MDLVPLMLVFISAVSHALWNFFAKGSRDKEAFMWLINFSSLVFFIPVFYFILPEFYFPVQVLPFFILSAVAENIYFFALGKAYEKGDLSVVYPLVRSSPLLITIFAIVLLDEMVSGWGMIGIFLIVIGAYMLHLEGLGFEDFLKPLMSLRDEASRYAVLAALGTTVYSLSDKIGVTTIDPVLYSFWLGFFITGAMTVTVFKRRKLVMVKNEARSFFRVIVTGLLMKGGYILVLVVMSFTEVSYVLALRQVSVIFGVLLGVLVLREKYGKVRLVSSFIIFLGVYILGALA